MDLVAKEFARCLANCNFASDRACNNVTSPRCMLFISKALSILANHTRENPTRRESAPRRRQSFRQRITALAAQWTRRATSFRDKSSSNSFSARLRRSESRSAEPFGRIWTSLHFEVLIALFYVRSIRAEAGRPVLGKTSGSACATRIDRKGWNVGGKSSVERLDECIGHDGVACVRWVDSIEREYAAEKIGCQPLAVLDDAPRLNETENSMVESFARTIISPPSLSNRK